MSQLDEYGPIAKEKLNKAPWQEKGWKCRYTDSGICVARVAVACRFPNCHPLGINWGRELLL